MILKLSLKVVHLLIYLLKCNLYNVLQSMLKFVISVLKYLHLNLSSLN